MMPHTKTELVERLQAARSSLDREIRHLDLEDLARPGPDEGWSAKDHLAHLAVWEQGTAALLRRQPRYAAMGLDEQTWLHADHPDGHNRAIYELNRQRSASEILATLDQAHEQLLAALEPLGYADLLKTYSDYQPDEPGEDSGAPILAWVADVADHYAEHQTYIRALVN